METDILELATTTPFRIVSREQAKTIAQFVASMATDIGDDDEYCRAWDVLMDEFESRLINPPTQ